MRATYLAALILFDLITLIVSGEAYKLRSSLFCSLLQPPATSSLLKTKYSPQHPVLEHH
jgi:hypothetical protein